jgi:lactate 2-monooxygenase
VSHFAEFQRELQLAGTDGETAVLPCDAVELESRARALLPAEVFGYVAGGAGAQRTVAANGEAFPARRLIPRVWRGTTDESARSTETQILGTTLAAPVFTAPIGALDIAAPKGDLVVAETAAELGIGFVLSTVSSATIEEVGAVAGRWWFQLYWPDSDDLARSLVHRAVAAGAEAIVVTADCPRTGWRPAELDHGLHPFLRGLGVANYLSDPVFRAGLAEPPDSSAAGLWAAILKGSALFGNHRLGPGDLERLRKWTSLPIVVKGVQHRDDARAVVAAGADAVVVSNHGGRQIDGAVASLDMLEPIADAVGDRAEVLFDSGVRSGSDVLIALACGAKAVFYGRPWVYGLSLAGRDGVRHVLRTLLADLDLTAGLAGVRATSEVDADLLHRPGLYG